MNFLANNTATIGKRTPQLKLARMFIIKTPNALPIKNAMPMMPLAINSHFMARSDFSINTGAAHSRANPIKP